MSINRNHWSNSEDSILAAKIKEHGVTLGAAYASKILGRTQLSCTSRFYNIKNKAGIKATVKTEGVDTSPASVNFMGFDIREIDIKLKERKIILSI